MNKKPRPRNQAASRSKREKIDLLFSDNYKDIGILWPRLGLKKTYLVVVDYLIWWKCS